MQTRSVQHIDLFERTIYPIKITFDTHIQSVRKLNPDEAKDVEGLYAMPGFVDAHIHIESSMLVPSEFARMAVVHGSVGTVSDPHEIANVLGVPGVDYMLEDAAKVPFKFNFGAPSCVPATAFETAGAEIDAEAIRQLLKRPEIKYLAEMMNWPGVLHEDGEVMAKIAAAKELKKPIDGHAPGLMGDDAIRYISHGISTDHECFTYEEGLHKLKQGMKILIREGSAAKNFDALIDLLKQYPSEIMFCSDDKHPDDLIEGHIDELVRRAVKVGCDFFEAAKAATIHPVTHYGLDIGLLKVGDPADFILIDQPNEDFKVLETWVDGQLVAKDGTSKIARAKSNVVNNFQASPIQPTTLKVQTSLERIPVIEVEDGQLITEKGEIAASEIAESGTSIADDVLKLVVYNRYHAAQPAVAWVKNFELKSGALASTVAHDSHNIIAVGVDDESLADAINLLVENKGGISYANGSESSVLPLEIAGIMTDTNGYDVAHQYTAMNKYLKEKLGCGLSAPYMTLSFLALLVIPKLKLSDKGLFDAESFEFVAL